jgi:hypothetical protein
MRKGPQQRDLAAQPILLRERLVVLPVRGKWEIRG